MIPISTIFVRNAITAAATAAAAVSFSSMDSNPTLFLANKFRSNDAFYEGKKIWIIGASSGIGEQLAYQLADTVADVSPGTTNDDDGNDADKSKMHLILSSRSKEKLENVAVQCRSRSNSNCYVSVLPMDVCSEPDVLQSILNEHISNIDIVVMNSGVGQLQPALQTSSQTTKSILESNALWPMIVTPMLLNRTSSVFKATPHIVVTASIGSILPVPLSAAYAGAKHAVLGYFRSLQCELGNNGILLHTILPGPINTNFHATNDEPTSIQRMGRDTGAATAMKMSSIRCAELMLTAMQSSACAEFWIAKQPVLTSLYIHTLMPMSWMQKFVYNTIGAKRMEIYNSGNDLYNPKSWTVDNPKEKRN